MKKLFILIFLISLPLLLIKPAQAAFEYKYIDYDIYDFSKSDDYIATKPLIVDFTKIEELNIIMHKFSSSDNAFLFSEFEIQVYKYDYYQSNSIGFTMPQEVGTKVSGMTIIDRIKLVQTSEVPGIVEYGIIDLDDQNFSNYFDGYHHFQIFFKINKSLAYYSDYLNEFLAGESANIDIPIFLVSYEKHTPVESNIISFKIMKGTMLHTSETFTLNVGESYNFNLNMTIDNYIFDHWIVNGNKMDYPFDYEFTFSRDTAIVAQYVVDPNKHINIDDLPKTSGSIYKSTGTVGNVDVDITNNKVTLLITYEGYEYYLEPFIVGHDTDLTPFEMNNAFYFTDDNDKFIVFNYDKDKSIFTQDEFVPYTVLNLKTFEFKLYDKVITRMHVDGADGNLWTYFYIDQYVIDNLLSITVSFYYRYTYPLGFIFKPSDWQHHSARYDEEMLVNVSLPWYLKVGAYTGILNSVLIKSATSKIESIKFNEITALKQTELSSDLLAEINAGYKSSDANFEQIRNDLSLFRVFLGTFQSGLSTGVQVYNNTDNPDDTRNMQVIEFTYMTSGKINTVKAKDIDLKLSFSDSVVPKDEENPNIAAYVLLIVIAITFVMSIVSGSLFRRRGLRNLIVIILFEVGIYLLWVFEIIQAILRL